jgi:poly-gamma-glutamate synthesis protein (capsule biosynthesis protein)
MSVGDVNLAWHVGEKISSEGPDVVFQHVRGLFEPADLIVANLECSLSDAGEPWPGKEVHFAAPEGAAQALVAAGVDVVTLANNHTLDFSRAGLLETMSILDASGVEHIGAGVNAAGARSPVLVDRNGLRVALLSYVLPFSSKAGFKTRAWAAKESAPGVAVAVAEEVRGDVSAARRLADIVVVFVHSGGEFRAVPKPNQLAMAAVAIEAGASMVIGHGPHNLQGYVRHGRTLVAYSIGNFVFDDYTGRQNETAILDVSLSAEGVESVNWIPIVIEDGLPRPARPDERERIMRQLAVDPDPRD